MDNGGMVLVGTVSKVVPAETRQWKDQRTGTTREYDVQSIFIRTGTEVFETTGEPCDLVRGQKVAMLVEVSTSAQGRQRVQRAGLWDKAEALEALREVYGPEK